MGDQRKRPLDNLLKGGLGGSKKTINSLPKRVLFCQKNQIRDRDHWEIWKERWANTKLQRSKAVLEVGRNGEWQEPSLILGKNN